MADQRAFDLRRTQPVTGDVQNVINSPDDPEVTILVPPGSVAGKVTSLDLAPILLFVTLLIAPNRPQHGRPRLADDEFTPDVRRNFLPLVVDHRGIDPKKRQGRSARFKRRRPGKRSNHDRSSLGLPPRIDDWAAPAANHGVIPNPCFGIDRFPDRPKQPQ